MELTTRSTSKPGNKYEEKDIKDICIERFNIRE